VQVHLTVTLIYDLDEEVPPNVPDRHSKFRKTSRKEKPAIQTRSSSMKLKRPPQDSVARKPSSKDQIPRKKQRTESTVSSSRKDKKSKSKKHKKKKHKSKKKKRGKRKYKANSNRKRHRSQNRKQERSAEGKSKDSSSRLKIIRELKELRSTEARKLSSEEPELELITLPAPKTSEGPGLIPPAVPSISAVVPPPPGELRITEDNDENVVALPKF
jgi:hypothetical protein